jgi:pimeloyl-ACP methyl ester carboxylesterase
MTTRGDRPRVVVALHGVPLTPSIWGTVAEDIHSLEAPDLRREAPSDAPELALSAGALQQEIARRLLRQFDGTGAVDVIGHSYGGQVAIELALLLQERLRSLTLLCTRDTPFPAFAETAAAVRSRGVPDPREALARWFTVDELEQAPAVVDYAAECLRVADPSTYADALAAIASYRPTQSTSTISARVTVIAAGGDRVSPPDAMRAMAGRFPRAESIVVDGWAHMSPFAAPERLAAMLLAALDRA